MDSSHFYATLADLPSITKILSMNKLLIEADPVPVEINSDHAALIIIDMQNDFLRRGGYGELLGNNPEILARTIEPIGAVLKAAREKSMMVIHTREGHQPDLSDCPNIKRSRWPEGRRIGDMGPMGRILIRGEVGHQIIDDLKPMNGEPIIDKPGKSAFYKTDLERILRARGITDILFTGVTTDICGVTSIAAANDRGFNAVVLADCMASYDPARHMAALDIIKAQGGILGSVTDSQKVLEAFSRAI